MPGEVIYGLIIVALLIVYAWVIFSDEKKQRQKKEDLKSYRQPKSERSSMDSVKRANEKDSAATKLDYSARYIPPHGHEGFDDNW